MRIKNDQDVLDCLRQDLAQLGNARGNETGQQGKLDSYKAVIRELEAQLEHERYWLSTEKPTVEKSLSTDKEFGFSTKVHNMFELAKIAFRTDSTRVITFSLDWIYGAIKVPGGDRWLAHAFSPCRQTRNHRKIESG